MCYSNIEARLTEVQYVKMLHNLTDYKRPSICVN